ncbi:MAG: transcription termination/antitermination protein NusA [Planctomycetes bacterium]|nr:transcription termination/antitermination protein NusA [Planctomycetota bacterium]MBM4078738.1 transcription termination/antitermination protein NusA [Planctomycetota bacterium]MBM4083785.1 transcription termination/antitermination protein NusA [Planctomycetota bacterium]
MDGSELLRLVDSLHRDKDIDKELVLQGIEAALLSAARKHLGLGESVTISIDRKTGAIIARDGEHELAPVELGRIAAQTAKQVMIQKIREAERDVVFTEYEKRVNSIVTGSVVRFEGPNMIINVGRTEAILPRTEQIPNEFYHPGERLRALIAEVKKVGHRVRIVLSRNSPDFVRRLFDLEVPEIAEKIIEVRAVAREAGHRTKIAVVSNDSKVDCVGACVGVRGTRIRNIVDELNGEKIDIVRWNDAPEVLIMNTLKPAEIANVLLDEASHTAVVLVPEDQLSLAIGKKGQNVRLTAKLTGWDIDIMTEAQLSERRQKAKKELAGIPGGDKIADKLCETGYSSLELIAGADVADLTGIEGIDEKMAAEILAYAQNAIANKPSAPPPQPEPDESRQKARKGLAGVPGGDKIADKLCETGYSSLELIAGAGVEGLTKIEGIDEKMAAEILAYAQSALAGAAGAPAEQPVSPPQPTAQQ